MKKTFYFLVTLTGFCSLSWEVIWQIKSTLALGLSALGTAMTLAVTMFGLGLGGLLMGKFISKKRGLNPFFAYGVLEILIGIAGLYLKPGFNVLAKMDSFVYLHFPHHSVWVHIVGMIFLCSLPTLAMGATLPVFAEIASRHRLSVSAIYGLNTIGAAIGCLVVALLIIPLLSVSKACLLISGLNLAAGIWAMSLSRKNETASDEAIAEEIREDIVSNVKPKDFFIVFATGYATFSLEVAWFRSFSATFQNSADTFAIMLAGFLIALGLASRSVSKLRSKGKTLGQRLCIAGALIMLITPFVEWLDVIWLLIQGNIANPFGLNETFGLFHTSTFAPTGTAYFKYFVRLVMTLGLIFLVVIPPLWFLGSAFPWLLEDYREAGKVGRLYAMNMIAAILGSMVTAWLTLPLIGFARSAWIAGILIVIAGLMKIPKDKIHVWMAVSFSSLIFAFLGWSGIGKERAQGYFANMEGRPARVIEAFDGPEATVSVVEYSGGGRRIIINSSSASGQSGPMNKFGEHYMHWMGHLPMLLHSSPKTGLVICFGTGQTANVVRREGIEHLDIVEINPRILKLAHNFSSNEEVLSDHRVRAVVMDGRAYLRRTQSVYDIITLEPMPPNDAGVNALYSREFYETARDRLSEKGVIAQWLPFYCVAPSYSASIAKTFLEVFTNSVLWIDPSTKRDGILLGTKDGATPIGISWPGYLRPVTARDLEESDVKENIVLNSEQLRRYSQFGKTITDDNQILTYGKSLVGNVGVTKENFQLLKLINTNVIVPETN